MRCFFFFPVRRSCQDLDMVGCWLQARKIDNTTHQVLVCAATFEPKQPVRTCIQWLYYATMTSQFGLTTGSSHKGYDKTYEERQSNWIQQCPQGER